MRSRSSSSFADNIRLSLAKDYFVRGLSSQLQLAIKSERGYDAMDVKAVAKEAVRLELAGVGNKTAAGVVATAHSCDDMVDAVAEKVIEKLAGANFLPGHPSSEQNETNAVSGVDRQNRNRGYRGRSRGRASGNNRNHSARKCRCCLSSEHLIKDCPTRFCQACGGRGHDQYSSSCPNFQP